MSPGGPAQRNTSPGGAARRGTGSDGYPGPGYGRASEPSRSRWDGAQRTLDVASRLLSPRVRAAVGVASLLTVAIVPGAAMAAGAITVAADAYCTFGSFCLYSGPNFDGQKVEYSGQELFCQDSRPALNVRSVLPSGARSVVNNTRNGTTGLGVKIYSAPEHLVLTTISPGGQVSELDGKTAQSMQSLCAYPRGN
ncbi:peptidase inhibitor family I36 protein [Pseudonocardia sp. Cha107L01]|uniref:peptidase inhibitor family I36 protein n=1 Tax=Pseudonocardia sp. Cha107L01 TaxID=3457576 RepID=UPI0028C7C731|nr:hypothetical protein [Pseudonocardiales bacterium]